MSDYETVVVEEINKLIDKHEMDLIHVRPSDGPICVLYRIIKCQAEQLAELKADLNHLAIMVGFGDCL